MQFVRNTFDTLFRIWELGVSFLGRLNCQYSRATKNHVANFSRNKEQSDRVDDRHQRAWRRSWCGLETSRPISHRPIAITRNATTDFGSDSALYGGPRRRPSWPYRLAQPAHCAVQC